MAYNPNQLNKQNNSFQQQPYQGQYRQNNNPQQIYQGQRYGQNPYPQQSVQAAAETQNKGKSYFTGLIGALLGALIGASEQSLFL